MSHSVAFYIHTGLQLLDLAGPLDVFQSANDLSGVTLYDLKVVSRLGGVVVSSAGAPIGTVSVDELVCDTLLICGGDVERMLECGEVSAVAQLAANAPRIASVCTGAFLLAATGLLDGRRATTHWSCARRLEQLYPAVLVDADRIFISDGDFWTSAGVSAGIDLALALIEQDHGSALAHAVAQELVVFHRRPGGQSQFSSLSQMEPQSDRMRMALSFAREHLAEPLPLERLAQAARLSSRQFGRAFRQETGETPGKAVERLRVEAARVRLQDGVEPVEAIALAVGFNDPERMRRAFIKLFGRPPQAIRRDHKKPSSKVRL